MFKSELCIIVCVCMSDLFYVGGGGGEGGGGLG